jgi:hypothetical protein
MAIVCQYGKLDLFITMTCNPKWEEIISALKPGEIANDRPDLVTHIFFGKLQHLLHKLLKKGIFGKVVANIHVIEWQKRSLPHIIGVKMNTCQMVNERSMVCHVSSS